MKLLLTGEPHAGKSTLLARLLQNIDNKQGFITSEITKDGQRTGFELVSSEDLRTLFADIHSSSEKRVSRYGVKVDSLNEFIDKLPEINRSALLYIDEIGQMQLFSEKFQELAATYIASSNNFIGTVSKVYNHEFIDELKNNEELEIIEVTPMNRDQLFIDILAKLKSAVIPTNNPEKEILDDNARKFVSETLDPKFLEVNSASSFALTVDWLETDEDNEVKIARKEFDNGEVQVLLIAKTTKDGDRTSEKEKTTEERYQQLKASSVLHLKKKRYEFAYSQNGTSFSIKYDEFTDGKLNLLEVDASSEEERNSFKPDDFPAELKEVTGDIRYYGYRVAELI